MGRDYGSRTNWNWDWGVVDKENHVRDKIFWSVQSRLPNVPTESKTSDVPPGTGVGVPSPSRHQGTNRVTQRVPSFPVNPRQGKSLDCRWVTTADGVRASPPVLHTEHRRPPNRVGEHKPQGSEGTETLRHHNRDPKTKTADS